jgi:LmbE family N-acetylglucosaminyl deacetylase
MNASYPSGRRAAAGRRTPRANVLVVAPHPDDDAIGCGGTLARLAARGAHISVVYVTDGSASHPNSRRFPPAVLRDVRENEARAALRKLGVRTEPAFLRAPDSGLSQLGAADRGRLAARIAARITATHAGIVFAPWSRDPHPDHVVSAELTEAALALCARRPAVWYYHVWLPVRGNADEQPRPSEVRACDIVLNPGERARKRAAILAHRSQTGVLVDDDPAGFVIDTELLAGWLGPVERFYRRMPVRSG